MDRIVIDIERLGRVVDSRIEIAPMMIFSGESGMGKSYLAMLSHYFFDIYIVFERFTNLFESLGYVYKDMAKDFVNEGEAFTMSKVELEEWMSTDAIAYLGYMLNAEGLEGKIRVSLPTSVPDQLTFTYKKELSGIENEESEDVFIALSGLRYRATHNAINDVSPYASLLAVFLMRCVFGDTKALEATFLMPPSRGPVLSEQVTANSGMYKDFVTDINDLSNVLLIQKRTSPELMEQLSEIMEGEVKKEEGRFVYITDGVKMPIAAAAASVREIAPLQLLARKWDVSKTALLIEEPEAHLHPDKQRMMADIIGCLFRTGAFIHLTTHSDYFLRRINELILFRRYVDSHSEEEIAALSEKTGIKPSFAINGNDVVAYILERQHDGHSKVVAQDLRDGVPFSAFSNAVKESFRVNDLLEEAFES